MRHVLHAQIQAEIVLLTIMGKITLYAEVMPHKSLELTWI